jgi:hypothetical protein
MTPPQSIGTQMGSRRRTVGLPHSNQISDQRANAVSHKGNAEREGFEPSWRVTPPTAFPESVRSLTGPVWSRLVNTNSTVMPSGSDWLRLPIGIGVGIGRTANRGHWNQPSTSSTALMEPAAL